MKYKIEKRGDKFVVLDSDGKVVSEHDSEQEARAAIDDGDDPGNSQGNAGNAGKRFASAVRGLKFSPDGGTVEGYGVIFNSTDLHGQVFTKDTNYHFTRPPNGMPVLWEHGLDGLDGVIGTVKNVTTDDIGHWYQIKLDQSNKYYSAIRQLGLDGRLGLSTGTSPHMMKVAGNQITEFGTLECSLTICPAEPGTIGVNTKTVGYAVANNNREDDTHMANERMNELEQSVKNLTNTVQQVLGVIQNAPGATKHVYSDGGEDDPNPNTKNFADYLIAIQRGDEKRLKSVYGSVKGLDSTSGETGGYLVPEIFVGNLMRIEPELNVFMEQYGAMVVPMSSAQLTMPALYQAGTYVAGQSQYHGGVKFVGVGEGKDIPETKPAFDKVTLTATKQAGYVELTDELGNDSGVALERILTRLFGEAMAYRKMWLFLRGSGVDEPLGIYQSGLTVTSDLTDASPTLAEFHKMAAPLPPGCYSRAYWFVHPFLQYLMTSLVSGVVPYQQNLQRSPFSQPFNGRPVVVTDAVPATIATGGIGLFDIGYYGIGERSGIEIAFSTDVGFLQDKTYWRVKQRFDGRPLVTGKVNISGSNEQSPFVIST